MFLEHNWEKALKSLNEKGDQAAFIYTKDPKKIFKKIKSKFNSIEAAGGIVYNPKGNILTIKRLGKWDFPKGKKENKETWKECALREVEEECGVSNLKLDKLLVTTYHSYSMNGKKYLKKTKWYKMYLKNYSNTTPQLEEDITEIAWLHPSMCLKNDFDTYSSIKEMLYDAKVNK